MSKHTLKAVCALILALCLGLGVTPAMAQSQASSGQIAGVVTDSQGAAISKATVKVTNTQTGLERTVTASEDGIFRHVLLPPGIYKVTVEASGFSSTTIDKVEVVVGRTADVNVSMGASGVQETVTVSAGAVQIQTTRSEADAVINESAISNLPINGRRFQDFVTLTPTAQVDPQRGQISLVGQRGIYGANINVDGVDYNQPFFGGIRGGERSNTAFTIPQESIKEFQVVASGYSAEFGRSTGGIVNAVTKSGTNEWHGSGFVLYRPKDLSRKNLYFDALETSINDPFFRDPANNTFREVTAAPTQTQAGGSFGGPVKKDKAFFFVSYEYQRVRNEREAFFDLIADDALRTANTAEAFDHYRSLQEPFTATNDAHAVLGRFDYEINSNHRFNIRYSYSRNEALNANATGNALSTVTRSALSNNGTEKDNTNTIIGQLASTFGSNVVNEVRTQYSREERPRQSNVEAPLVSTSIGNYGTVSFLPTTQFDWRFQVADALTWTKGNHTFKFGGEYNHVFIDQLFGFNQFGAYSLFTGTTALLDILSVGGTTANRFDSTLVTYRRQTGNLMANYSTDEIAFFGQDAWRIRPNLTVNFGLRWEGQYNPDPEANNEALINLVKGFTFPSGHEVDPTVIPDATNQFGPRVGFAWDPKSDGKMVIRGYAGIYFARTPLLLLAGPFNNFRSPAGDLSASLPFNTGSLPTTDPRRNCRTLWCQLNLIGINLNNFPLGNLPNITPQQIQQVAQALGLPFNPNIGVAPTVMDRDFENPQSTQAGIGFEREVLRGFTVGADFSYVNTVDLQRNRDLNLPTPGLLAGDPAQRPFYGLRGATGRPAVPRPIPTLGSIQVRESSGRALYRALTVSAKFQRSWGQLSAFYTLSKSLSDDDNERDAGGVAYDNAYNYAPEYNYSRLDRRHQFVVNPVIYLPLGIDISAAIRARSGRPVDATQGSDLNEDIGGPDRPYLGPGVPFLRNSFRNFAIYNLDFRVQKKFSLGESRRLLISAEFFNFLNLENIELQGTAVTNFCASTSDRSCGFLGPTNPNFLSKFDRSPTSTRFGNLLLSNNPGAPFQMQIGARFTF
ncbi:MAG: carboxypeptidase regulatory-like domain-containing protein [Acidobacteriota bacterium]